jgi:hypothetical protein
MKEIAERSGSSAIVERFDFISATACMSRSRAPFNSLANPSFCAETSALLQFHDGTGIAHNSTSPALNLRPPTAPERVLFRFPDRLPNLFRALFCCCKLHAFLYIGGYKIHTQSKLKPSNSVAFAVCCACFSLHHALPAGAL